jgi:cob(I)alamin adenosyltransferase
MYIVLEKIFSSTRTIYVLQHLFFTKTMSQEHRYIVRRLYIIYTLLIISIFLPSLSLAQELVEDKIEVIKAVVLEVKDKDKELIPTFNIENKIQEVKAKITEGENKDREITFNNDFTPLSIGEVFYLNHTIDKDGSEYFAMLEPYRLDVIYLFLGIFILLTILIGGIQGIRGLISLAISLILIVYALVPFILSGYSPILVSILVSSVIIILGSYITHGFNKTTTSAVFGMILTVIEVNGALDEATSFIGWAREQVEDEKVRDMLSQIQHDLYEIMGYLAGALLDVKKYEAKVTQFEKQIDVMTAALPPLKRFILPQGSEATTRLHIARTIVRSAERRVVRYVREKTKYAESKTNQNDLLMIKYLNRLSDLFFTLSRKYAQIEKIT